MRQVWKPTMSYSRGEVVLVRFPNSDLITYKKRPALVIQDEHVKTGLNQRLVVQITSNLKRKGKTRVLVRKNSQEWKNMGLLGDSVIVADNIATVVEREVDKAIGRCTVMPEVDKALRRILRL